MEWSVTVMSVTVMSDKVINMMLLAFAVGLLQYCNFGHWTTEEDQQLRKNWKKIVEVCIYAILGTVIL